MTLIITFFFVCSSSGGGNIQCSDHTSTRDEIILEEDNRNENLINNNEFDEIDVVDKSSVVNNIEDTLAQNIVSTEDSSPITTDLTTTTTSPSPLNKEEEEKAEPLPQPRSYFDVLMDAAEDNDEDKVRKTLAKIKKS